MMEKIKMEDKRNLDDVVGGGGKMKLGEIVKISKGRKYEEVPFELSKHRYLNIEDLHGGKAEKYTNEKGVEVCEQDVLIAWDGANAGKVGVGFKGVIGSTLARLSPIIKDVDSRFLYWFLEFSSDFIKSQRTGATIPHVNGQSLRDLDIPLPPLSIQRDIATLLDTADALRQKDKALLRHYDALAQAIFIDMFGDPVANEKGWEVKKLGEVCSKITDGTHLSPKFQSTGIPFLFVSNIVNNQIVYNTDTFISQEDFDVLAKRMPIEIGNILLTTVGSYGNPAIIEKLDKFAFQRHIAFLKPNHDIIDYKFLFGALKSPYIQKQIDRRVKGIAQKTLNLSELKDIEILMPEIALQKKYAQILDNLNEQQKKNRILVNDSDSLFQTLLQRSFG